MVGNGDYWNFIILRVNLVIYDIIRMRRAIKLGFVGFVLR